MLPLALLYAAIWLSLMHDIITCLLSAQINFVRECSSFAAIPANTLSYAEKWVRIAHDDNINSFVQLRML